MYLLRTILISASMLWLLSGAPARAQSRVELLTIEPGDAMWARFGHTALRVLDGQRDIVFNYGAAPFLKPSFLWASMRGRSEFYVIAETGQSALQRYQKLDRTVVSQELKLPLDRQRWLIERLYQAVQPPNNRYRYDQLYDNCATRVRDVIDEASGGALRRASLGHVPGRNFRDDTLEAMSGHWFASWGFDLIGGPHQDLPVDGYQELYLPQFLHDRVAEARLSAGSSSLPLAGPDRVLYKRQAGPARWPHKYFVRGLLIALACALLGLFAGYLWLGSRAPGGATSSTAPRSRRPLGLRRAAALGAATYSALSALFGLVVVPITALSNVHNISPNENAWLFFPLDLLLVKPLYRAALTELRPARWVQRYVAVRAGCVAVLLLLKVVGVAQQHNWVFVLTAVAWGLSALGLSFALGRSSHEARVAAPDAGADAAVESAGPAREPGARAPGKSRGGQRTPQSKGRSRATSRAGLSSRKP